jgi:Tol biopolymer transport system component
MSHRISHRTVLTALLALLALALPAAAQAKKPSHTGAVVFSKATEVKEGEFEGGLFAVRYGRLNQLTENPADVEPDFSADGRSLVFARNGDIYTMRPDGSGQRQLTSGPEVDSAPKIAPNGRYLVFERRAALPGADRDLYTVRIGGGQPHALVQSGFDDREATFSPDGRLIAYVRGFMNSAEAVHDDIYAVTPSGSRSYHLTTTPALDEWAPRFFAGGIVFSRGNDSDTPAAYADVYTMKRNGRKLKPQVRGVGSAFVEDVSPDGHTLLFRRSQGLWVKHIGKGRARKLVELPDQSQTNSVFSADGKLVAAFIADGEVEQLMSINLRNHRRTELADSFEAEAGSIGPVMTWQP